MTCGFSYLPTQPGPGEALRLLSDSYLKCRAIRAYVLDPEVNMDDYPGGHFGTWVRDGTLVTDRISLTNEDDMRRVFSLLTEAVDGPEEELEVFLETPMTALSFADYRRETGFSSVLSFDFIGDVPLRVDLGRSELVIHVGDQWTAYSLDQESAAALRKFLASRVVET